MRIRLIALSLIAGASLLLSDLVSVAAETALSTYTKELVRLLDLFSRLDRAVAERMQANERYLLANSMLRLSRGFYDLKDAKHDFVQAVRRSPGDEIDFELYRPAVAKLDEAVACLARQFRADGARLGAFTQINGAEMERQLRTGIENKVATVRELAQQLGLSSREAHDQKELIVRDGERAENLAEQLYMKTAEFAHTLDPTIIPPSQRQPCTF